MQDARRISEGDFPPTAHQIIESCEKLCRDEDPDRYRLENGGQRHTGWYKAMRKANFHAVRLVRRAALQPQATPNEGE